MRICDISELRFLLTEMFRDVFILPTCELSTGRILITPAPCRMTRAMLKTARYTLYCEMFGDLGTMIGDVGVWCAVHMGVSS